MAGPATLDTSTARRLARLDPALRLLPHALPAAWTTAPYVLHDLQWAPGERCRLVVRLRDPSGAGTFVSVDVRPDGWSRHDYRDDAGLPGLPGAADPEQVCALLAPRLDGPVRTCRVEAVRYRPGSRCVLRYDVRTGTTWTALYAKVLAPAPFVEAVRVQQALAAPVDDRPVLVPRLVSVWPDQQTMVAEAVPGSSVSTLIAGPGTTEGGRLRVAHDLGALLAAFHAHRAAPARRWCPSEQLAALESLLAAARVCDPATADRASQLLDRLASRPPPPPAEVLAHGGFRAGQVLRSPAGRLVVLDTDGARRSDPCADLGTALAHLRWCAVRSPGRRTTLLGAEQAFLSGYAAGAGDPDPAALAWWHAAGLLQVALRRYRRLEVAAWGRLPALVDAASDLLDRHRHPGASTVADPLDVRQMTRVLREAVTRRAGCGTPVVVESATELRSAHGGRSVVRYSVRGLDGAAPVSVVAKRFTEQRRAQLLYDHLGQLDAGPFADGPLRVPAPVAWVPDLRLVVYRHCEGLPLHRLTPPASAVHGARRAARWLARLHASDVRLPRTLSLDQEARSTREWAWLIGDRHPRLAAQADELAQAWLAAARAATGVTVVPIHKDFHPGHVLVGGDLSVIDLDEARSGDPTFDVAHFCCYLGLLSPDGGGAARDAFLAEYVGATGWRDPGSRGAFSAYTWLKIAKQYAVGTGPQQPVPAARRADEVGRALAEGARCLSG
ncbi:phosphotransferase [Nocardioides panacis]|uniref:Phosphotransferase n=1 Tax=Nocardioides panacis TaxID=2849501 RepID=A0A975Y072_9ACTN|nr:phosphotransferase [Nocardioides panacis]QWZ08029.1 phosphotransferase [Nocardioides panacis]